MKRGIFIFLFVLFAVTAFARYRIEVAVVQAQAEMDRIEASAAALSRSIQMLRAEIAYLENPDRLARIAGLKTQLRPSTASQAVDAVQFAAAFDRDHPVLMPEGDEHDGEDIIFYALAMAGAGFAETSY